MNSAQKIIKNIGITGISQIIVSLLAFVLLIYIARYFGEADFGIYNFALSFTSLFTIFADIGLSGLLIREIARNKEHASEYLTNTFIIKLILSLISFGLIALTINIMNYPSDVVFMVYIFGVYTILSSFAQIFMSIFQAFERMEYTALTIILEKIVIISLGLSVLLMGYGLIELAYVYVIASIIQVLISFALVLKKITKPSPKINFTSWKMLTLRSLPFGINTLFYMIFFKIDTILLSILKDDISVGIYSAAYNPLLAFGSVVSSMVISGIYPAMSKYFISSKNNLEYLTIFSYKYMVIIGIPLAVGLFILADRFIELFYAGQFKDSIIVFQILSLFIPLRLLSNITGTLLTSINKQGIRASSIILCSIFNIILNLALIPSLSYIGASIATVMSEVLLYVILLYLTTKFFTSIKWYDFLIKPLVASLIMGTVIIYFREINLFLIIIISIFTYLLILILLKTFTSEDKYLFNKLLEKIKD